MSHLAHAVALITRGAGAYTYTYSSAASHERGQLCAVSFRDRLEFGVITGPAEPDNAGRELLPLIPVSVTGFPQWGVLLCDLAALSASMPREIAGHLLFATPSRGLHAHLEIENAAALPAEPRSGLAALAGRLTPEKRRALLRLGGWPELAKWADAGAIALRLEVAGTTETARPHSKLSKYYSIDRQTAGLLGLPRLESAVLPGGYLAGLQEDLDFPWPSIRRRDLPDAAPLPAVPRRTSLAWEAAPLSADWAVCRQWPSIARLNVRRTQADWRTIRNESGLIAELAADAQAGCRVLLLAPMNWMLERLWPAFGPWATLVQRFRGEAGPSAAAVVLRGLERSGQIVCGLESAWKLAAYTDFDRIVVLDPSHPNYGPEGDPWLDARYALLLAMAGRPNRLDLVELGLSALDGRTQLRQVSLQTPHEPAELTAAQGPVVDLNPLPLSLRQPQRRRLVYFNRLGRSRGLRCMECNTLARCPQCSSPQLYYSAEQQAYRCSACDFSAADMRCRACGTAQLSAEYPGLEAIDRRRGDVLVSGTRSRRLASPEAQAVVGTMQLLEPVAEFWPQEIIYIHPDTRAGAVDRWPQALDMAARLAALYANPQLDAVYIISHRLAAQLGGALTAQQVAEEYRQELTLRRLARLPPYARLIHFRLWGRDAGSVVRGGREFLKLAGTDGESRLGWLSRPYARQGEYRISGYFGAPADLSPDAVQVLRARLASGRLTTSLHCEWGPWL